MNITTDPNLWAICALVFLLGLLIGVFLTAGGRRKWKTRYNSEVERRRKSSKRRTPSASKHWAEREKEWRERDSLRAAAVKDPPRRPADREVTLGALALDLREIGDAVHRVAEAHQQVQPPLALGGIGVVDRHMVEEVVDRRSAATRAPPSRR